MCAGEVTDDDGENLIFMLTSQEWNPARVKKTVFREHTEDGGVALGKVGSQFQQGAERSVLGSGWQDKTIFLSCSCTVMTELLGSE